MVTGNLQIKKGYYYAVINLKDENGKRIPKWISTGIVATEKNRKKAECFLAEEIHRWNERKGIFVKTNLAEYLEFWLTTIENEVRPNTYRGYCGNMRTHIIPYFKAHPVALQDVTPFVLEDYYYSLLRPESNLTSGAALSATTISHHHQNISKALADAVRRGLILTNPASSARLPKKEKFRPEFLNNNEVEEMLKLFEGNTVELPVQLCAIYGLRRSEVLGLKWRNIDFYKRSITISETLQQGEHGDYNDTTKTESSFRTLPMTHRAEKLLREQKEKQNTNRSLMGNYYIDNDYVCTWANGTVITPNYLTRVFHSVISHSTLPKIRLHDLRHSVASNLLNAGFSVVQVQEWLGHSSAATTLNFYAHVDKSSKMQIAKALDDFDVSTNQKPKTAVKIQKIKKKKPTKTPSANKKIQLKIS